MFLCDSKAPKNVHFGSPQSHPEQSTLFKAAVLPMPRDLCGSSAPEDVHPSFSSQCVGGCVIGGSTLATLAFLMGLNLNMEEVFFCVACFTYQSPSTATSVKADHLLH